jgi:Fe-S cluster assembly protein SufD
VEIGFRSPDRSGPDTVDLPAGIALSKDRSAALEEYRLLELPSTADELWRYTDITFLADYKGLLPDEIFDAANFVGKIERSELVDDRSASVSELASIGHCDEGIVAALAPLSGIVTVHNGVPGPILVSASLAEAGIAIEAASGAQAIPSETGFSLVTPSQDKFTALVAALGSALVISIPDGVVIENPLLVSMKLSAGDVPLVVPTHLVVETGKDSKMTLVVYYSGAGPQAGNPSLSLPVVEISVGAGSRLDYLALQDFDRSVCHVETSRMSLAREARTTSTVVSIGARLSRHRVESSMSGEYANSEMLGIYFANRDQHMDFRTLQDHQAPRTISDLLYKGAVEDNSTAVYAGLVRVEKDAQKINGYQTNKNLVLSEGASAESIPTLEILANDVRCSHASSIGPVDDEEVYYLESRGIDPEMAEQLIVEGFFEDVIDRIPSGLLAEKIRGEISEKFASRQG